MATKPTQELIWNDDDVNDTAPNAAKIHLGWEVDEAPSSSTFNWFQKYLAKVAAYVLEGIFVGTSSGDDGIDATGGGGDSVGVRGTGTGVGNGVIAIGGGTNTGGTGSSDGAGIVANASAGAPAIYAEAVTSGNGRGITAKGRGSGHGVFATGGATDGTGVAGTAGGSNGVGVFGTGGYAGLWGQNSAGTSAVAIVSAGSIDFSSATDVGSGTAVLDKLTKAMVPRAMGSFDGAVDTLLDYVNCASISHTSTYTEITLAQAMAGTDYKVWINRQDSGDGNRQPSITIQSSTVFRILVRDETDTALNPSAHGRIDFLVFGRQS